MFDSRDRSYRELPLRYAEFGVIHRNEASGALSGLTRVRRFVQDDSHSMCFLQLLLSHQAKPVKQFVRNHSSLPELITEYQHDTIVCTPDQIKGEIDDLFKFLDKVYGLFGFEYRLELSTRPDSFLGDIETWNTAEAVCKIFSANIPEVPNPPL